MATSTAVVLCFFVFLLPVSIDAATFEIVNNCSFTVWAAWTAMSPHAGGGNRLDPGQSWTINVTAGSTAGRIWARTNCSFDGSGRGRCETGDCGGALQCQGDGGTPPRTLAEFAVNQFSNQDFFDISLVDGYNVGLDFSPTSTGSCRGYRCATNSILEECPVALRTPGGCNHPCTVFGTPEYCCTGGQGTCGPTQYSTFFRTRCPDAYVGIPSDQPDTNDCPGGTSYRVTFCP